MNAVLTAAPQRANSSLTLPADLLFRLSVAQYHAMIKSGILGSGDPVELIDGYLVLKMTKNPAHELATGLILDILTPLLPVGWFPRVQGPVTTQLSEPEPDISLVRGARRDYKEHHPAPDDTALLIDVADTSLHLDQTVKKQSYARAGIKVYWIVNIPDRRIEVYTSPTGPAEEPDYGDTRHYGPDEQVPLIIEGREVGKITVRDVLP
jgi:Uma2 family endonuclease